jgi:hypothetical protein
MRRLPPGRWILAGLLCLLPAALYWDTIFHRYGFRDDYAVLRESHEEPGKILSACAAQGRPLYGLLMERSFRLLTNIEDLQWLRLGSAWLLGLVALAMYAAMLQAKWDRVTAALVAALLTVLPGSQLLVGWAVAWPLALALLLPVAGYAAVELASTRARGGGRLGLWLAGVGCVAASALIYQPNSLFYLVPVAAGLWPRRRWTGRSRLEWLLRHVATLALGLGAAFAFVLGAFAIGWFPSASYGGLEQDWIGKLHWFVTEPLRNAFATIVLDDESSPGGAQRAAVLAAFVVIAGVVREWQTRGWRQGLWWGLALAALLLGSYSVNLLAADRWAAYRTLLPLTGVVLIFLALAVLRLGGRKLARCGLAVLLLAGGLLAHRQAFELIAWPQGVELALLESGAERIAPAMRPRVYVITPTPFDRAGTRGFADEFGSLSTASDWAPKEMLALILRERHGSRRDARFPLLCSTGRRPPPPGSYDVVIDLRQVR